MSNFDDVRRAHRIMDALCNGNMVPDKEREFLRSFLPERPKQKTLEEIAWDIDFAWAETSGNDWKKEMFGDLETWLSDQHTQLRAHLEGVKSQAHPALPAGMRIAEHENFGRVVVSPGVGIDRCHEIFYLDPGMSSGTDISEVEPDSLTFIDSEPAQAALPTLPAGMQLADHEELGRVVVSPKPNQSFHTEVAFADNRSVTGASLAYVGADTLTPVGDKPSHPEFLGTEADYQSAPEGTVVAEAGVLAWTKEGDNDWTCGGGALGDRSMALSDRSRVLRWGWGK